MPATAHHRQVDASLTALHFDGQNVHVFVRARGFDRLLVQDVGQRRNAVAQFSSLLKLQLLGAGHHVRLQGLHHNLGFAFQELLGVHHVCAVSLRRDVADVWNTRAGTAFDLVQQTRPRAVGKNRVLAGAQHEHLLQQQHRLFHRPAVGVRAKIAVLFVHRATVVGHAGKGARGDFQIRIAFVVPKQNVVFRVERLDQVVFQQQRFRLGAHHGRLHPHDFAHHVPNAATSMVFLKVAGDAALQIDGFAHV